MWPMSVTAAAARLDAAGRVILVAGASEGPERDGALARFALDGTGQSFPDADASGFVRAVARVGPDRLVTVPRAMTVDRQGRVVTVGGGLFGGRRYGVVARWRADGALDRAFGTAGVLVLSYPVGMPARDLVLRAVLAEDDGSLLVAGGDTVPLVRSSVGVYARVTAEGTLDMAFGGVQVDTRLAAVGAVVADGDGYALAGDGVRDGAPSVLYLGLDGRPRAEVGERGLVAHTAPDASPMVVRAAVRDPDGGLVLAGGGGPQVWNQTPIQLVRFSSRRTPDRTWGVDGVVARFSAAVWNFEMCHAGALLPWTDGSVLVLGQANNGYRVHRILRDGRFDRDFGDNGVIGEVPPGMQYVFEMLPDGVGGLWVLYRGGMELEVGASHYAPS